MIYCKKYIMTNMPGIIFDDNGVCSPCNWSQKKRGVDWESRKKDLFDICNWAKKIYKKQGLDYIDYFNQQQKRKNILFFECLGVPERYFWKKIIVNLNSFLVNLNQKKERIQTIFILSKIYLQIRIMFMIYSS